MNVPRVEIERVVREVLAELDVARLRERRPATAARGLGTLVPSEADLVVTSRVVTMIDLSGRLNAARRVVVARNAIVTPAVHDELRKRGIALAYAESVDEPSASVRLAMIVHGSPFDPEPLSAGLIREGFKLDRATSDCIVAATDRLAADVAEPDTLGLLLTNHVAAGLCLANRLAGVRAVTGVDAPSMATAAAAVGANVLVVNPLAGSFFQLKQMVTEFGRGGVRPCPTAFQGRLA